MYRVYVIENEISGKIYIGQTRDWEKRLKRHNGILRSKVKSYTYKNKGGWFLIYKEDYLTRNEALKREFFLKSHKGRDWLKLVRRLGSSTVEQ